MLVSCGVDARGGVLRQLTNESRPHPVLTASRAVPPAGLWQMPDIETGFAFRKDMYKHMGITLPLLPPNKVLFMLRDTDRRKLENEAELVNIAKDYNVSYTYVRGRRVS